MSEENAQPHKFSVSMDDFIRFLVSKTNDSVCPACGTGHWTVIGSATNDMAFRMVTQLRDGPSSTQINTFALSCNECGFVRQHLARKVREWVDSNPHQEQLELEDLDEPDE